MDVHLRTKMGSFRIPTDLLSWALQSTASLVLPLKEKKKKGKSNEEKREKWRRKKQKSWGCYMPWWLEGVTSNGKRTKIKIDTPLHDDTRESTTVTKTQELHTVSFFNPLHFKASDSFFCYASRLLKNSRKKGTRLYLEKWYQVLRNRSRIKETRERKKIVFFRSDSIQWFFRWLSNKNIFFFFLSFYQLSKFLSRDKNPCLTFKI